MTDVLGLSTIVTLYQAGNGIYDLFDKVLLLDGGQEVFYGPLKEARPFMEKLGFVCRDGSNVGDYLTGALVPTERLIRPGCERTFPRHAGALRAEYEKSDIYRRMINEYDYPTSDGAREKTALFQQSIAIEKDSHLPNSSPLTVSFAAQVNSCNFRQYQIIWGDKPTFMIKQFATLFQALIAGSLFYAHSEDLHSGMLFSRSGALFFSLLHNSLMSMSEVTDSFHGRPILTKHKSFALYHPAAFCLAQITADIPIILVQITLFSLPVYFMAGLSVTASQFWTYWIFLFTITMVSYLLLLILVHPLEVPYSLVSHGRL
jgi:ABC-type multidrug transport system permease subunit